MSLPGASPTPRRSGRSPSLRKASPIRLAVLFAGLASAVSGGAIGGGDTWQFPGLRFRCPVVVESGIYSRTGGLVRCGMDFTRLLKGAGTAGADIDLNSIRLTSAGEAGRRKETPFVFNKASDFHPKTSARGEVIWQLSGRLEPLESRRYWVYFEVAGPKPRPRPKLALVPGALAGPRNVVRNPGFETPHAKDPTQAAHWEAHTASKATGRVRVVSDPHHDGKRALAVTALGGRNFGCRQNHIPMAPNRLYRATVWVRSDPANEIGAAQVLLTVWLYRKDGGRVRTSNAKLQSRVSPQPTHWLRIDARWLAYRGKDMLTPADTAYGMMQITLYPAGRARGAEAVGTFYVDDVELVEVTPKTRTPPPSVVLGKVERRVAGRPK